MIALRTGIIPALAIAFALTTGAAFAQTATPAPATPAPAAAAPAKKVEAPRTAVSLACSAAADKQNLHGKKVRGKFMSDCKHKGGPTN